MCTRKQLWLQECGNGLWQEKFEGVGRAFTEISGKEVDELNEANNNLFTIKQKTVVENQGLKRQLETAKREITTFASFASLELRDQATKVAEILRKFEYINPVSMLDYEKIIDTIQATLSGQLSAVYQKGKTDGKIETLKDETLP